MEFFYDVFFFGNQEYHKYSKIFLLKLNKNLLKEIMASM
jgi:hypothetical protein